MSMIDHSQIDAWEALVASKRRRLTDVASGATVRSDLEVEDISLEVERLESLINFYKVAAAAAA
jgi:hypothetical protein